VAVLLKGHEVIKRIDLRQAAGMDEAHEEIAYVSTVLGAKKETIPAMPNRHFQGPFDGRMPTA
jgi:hypothetical protein